MKMKFTVNCFLPYAGSRATVETVARLKESRCVTRIYILHYGTSTIECPQGCEVLAAKSLE